MMDLWRGVAVFDLGCKQMSRDPQALVLKLQNWLKSREFKSKKLKARALIREAEVKTARKSKSQPAAYRSKKKENLYSWPER